MSLESASFISQLVASNPVGASDPKSQGDDHLRLLKAVLQGSFPNIGAAMSASSAELNNLVGVTGLTGTGKTVRDTAPALLNATNNGLAIQKLFAYKAANLDRTSNVPALDPDLTLAIPGAGTYLYELNLQWMLPTGLGCVGLSGSIGYSGVTSLQGESVFAVTSVAANSGSAFGGAGFSFTAAAPNSAYPLIAKGMVITTNAGNLALTWAPFVTHANGLRLQAGSHFSARRVA